MPASLMLGRDKHLQKWPLEDPQTDLVFHLDQSLPGGFRIEIESAHAFALDQLQKAVVRQKRNYYMQAKGRDFQGGDPVWVNSPRRKKGRCRCHWVEPCEVLKRLGEVVYRVQLP